MFGLSPTHLVVLVCVIALVFGRKGKISDIMGDIGRGFSSLRKGLSENIDAASEIKKDLDKISHG